MKNKRLSTKEWGTRILLALLFIAIGSFIMVFFNPWGTGPKFDRIADYIAKIGVSGFLLLLALLARKSNRFQKYWQVLFALFILTVTVSLDLVFGKHLFDYLRMNDLNPAGWALPKLNELFVVVSTVIIFTLVSGNSLGSIYIQKGNLKLGLIIGLIAFTIFAVAAVPMATLFNAKDLSFARILPWTPWLLIFVFSNAAMEEILFRGLFLRKLEPFFGKFFSNFLIALVFTGIHLGAFYSADERIFIAILFPLALALGYIMQKTDSVWGSILLHAGMDIPIMIGIFSNL
ncbi:MAG: CPBP family intramembrane metalloprotease [Anaerolineaceae bacterium]|nr:CPBP family intramembrane metalloprotease [Anaerolineaceae bacterium]